jgi:hypothetical protein
MSFFSKEERRRIHSMSLKQWQDEQRRLKDSPAPNEGDLPDTNWPVGEHAIESFDRRFLRSIKVCADA